MPPPSIAQILQDEILSGALPPGTPLSQADLAMRFGVSRIPIRDALAKLSATGLITASPNRTATVLKMTRDEVIEAYNLRLLLEGDLLARAIPQMTDSHLSAIGYALERSSLEARQSNWAEGDRMFHDAIYAAAGQPRQQAMVNDLRRICCIQIAGYNQLTRKTDRWLTDHQRLTNACRAGNLRRATRILHRHLNGARNHLLREMGRKATRPA